MNAAPYISTSPDCPDQSGTALGSPPLPAGSTAVSTAPRPAAAGDERPARGGARDTVLSVIRGRRLRGGSRAVWLWGFALYAAAQLALVLALSSWRPTLTEGWKANKWEQLRNLAAAPADRPLLVMLGSSRTDAAFDPSLFDNLPGPGGKPWLAYNFGLPMVGPQREGIYLDEMLAAGIRPRLLLIEYVPALFNQTHKRVVSEESWTLAPWLPLSDLCRLWPYWSHPYRKAGEWLESRLAPWYALRYYLQHAAFPPPASENQPRFARGDWSWTCWPHDERGFRRPLNGTVLEQGLLWSFDWGVFYPTLKHLHIGQGPVQALCDLLERCRQEKIPTALVFMPESNTFRSWYCPEGLADSYHLFAEIGARYGALAIDASEWVADADFADAHHVGKEGARVFTTRLIEELRPLLAGLRDEDPPARVAAVDPH
jgi:hypothetical protein